MLKLFLAQALDSRYEVFGCLCVGSNAFRVMRWPDTQSGVLKFSQQGLSTKPI